MLKLLHTSNWNIWHFYKSLYSRFRTKLQVWTLSIHNISIWTITTLTKHTPHLCIIWIALIILSRCANGINGYCLLCSVFHLNFFRTSIIKWPSNDKYSKWPDLCQQKNMIQMIYFYHVINHFISHHTSHLPTSSR